MRRLDQRGWTRCNVCVKNLTARSVANGLQRGLRREVKEGGEPRSEADDGDMWVITAGGQRTRSPRETEGEKRIADDASVGGKPRRVGRGTGV